MKLRVPEVALLLVAECLTNATTDPNLAHAPLPSPPVTVAEAAQPPSPRNTQNPPPAAASVKSTEFSRLDMAARLGRYQAMDASWTAQQPIFVGRGYDFELGLTLDGVGAALAAQKRRQANLAVARGLDSQPRIASGELLDAVATTCGQACAALRERAVTVYGVLFGERHARLRTVLEVNSNSDSTIQYMAVGKSRAIEDFSAPGILRSEFDAGLDVIRQVLEQRSRALQPDLTTPAAQLGQCTVGDRTRVEGEVVSELTTHVLLQLRDSAFSAQMGCPRDAFSQE